MYLEMHCEGFRATEALSDYAAREANELRVRLPDSFRLQMFCKQEGPHEFSCVLTGHIMGSDFAVKETGGDLYALIHDSRKKFEHQVVRRYEKRRESARREAQIGARN